MARFNQTVTGSKTTNLANGEAYIQSPEMALISILLTSFANEQFYRSANSTFEELKKLISKCDPKFVAQAVIYARTVYGMRSISHVCASELGKYIAGKPYAKSFYNQVVVRPDDMMEILSYHIGAKNKVSNAMKKGFAQAFNRFDAYQLAKYRAGNKKMKLVDVVNLVHPIPIKENESALKALIANDLHSFDTWEAELTKAGQQASDEIEKGELKKEVWVRLISERKIGYFALLRNLRNIIQQAPDILPQALDMLTDVRLIKKSLVLPFRYMIAYEELKKENSDLSRKAITAINEAIELSLINVPRFEGRTLVALDISGSMSGRPAEIGSLFAAVLAKGNDCDVILFENTAKYTYYNAGDSVSTIRDCFRFSAGGTNFHSIFKTANKVYDRIIILSDMQAWIGQYTPKLAFTKYKTDYNCNPYIYSFDLQGYGTLQFPEQKVFCLTGFSDKVFDIMSLLETDKNVLINKIKSIEL